MSLEVAGFNLESRSHASLSAAIFLRRILLGLICGERELLNDIRVFGWFRQPRCFGLCRFHLLTEEPEESS